MKPFEKFKLKGTKIPAGKGETRGSNGKGLNCMDPESREVASWCVCYRWLFILLAHLDEWERVWKQIALTQVAFGVKEGPSLRKVNPFEVWTELVLEWLLGPQPAWHHRPHLLSPALCWVLFDAAKVYRALWSSQGYYGGLFGVQPNALSSKRPGSETPPFTWTGT